MDKDPRWGKTLSDATAARVAANQNTRDAAAYGIYQGQYRATLAGLIGAEIHIAEQSNEIAALNARIAKLGNKLAAAKDGR